MQAETLIQKVIDELTINGVVLIFNPHIFGEYMERVYAAGYDSGRRTKSKQKVVIQLDIHGNKLSEYESIMEAARINKIDHGGISLVLLGKRHTAGNYKWIYK